MSVCVMVDVDIIRDCILFERLRKPVKRPFILLAILMGFGPCLPACLDSISCLQIEYSEWKTDCEVVVCNTVMNVR